jgi:hypothetical protein
MSTLTLVRRDREWRIVSVLLNPAPEQPLEPHLAQEVKAQMEHYVDLFNREEAAAISTEIYSAPVLLPKAGDEKHTIVNSAKDMQSHWAGVFTDIKSKGWKRSVVHDMDIRVLTSHLALVDMTYTRLRADGTAIPPERRIATYMLIKRDSGWRIMLVDSRQIDFSG